MGRGVVAWQCVNAACARGMPHKVRFCPYCGTAQETTGASATAAALAGAASSEARAGGLPVHSGVAEDAVRGAHRPGAGVAGQRVEGEPSGRDNHARGVAAGDRAAMEGRDRVGSTASDAGAGGMAGSTAAGGVAGALAGGASAAAAGRAVRPRPFADALRGLFGARDRTPQPRRAALVNGDARAGGAEARPNQTMYGVPRPPSAQGQAGARAGAPRKPVRLRTLIAVFVVLWLVWMWTKPDKFAERAEQAVTLASVCNMSAARKELAALEAEKASTRQLDRIRAAIASARPACEPEPAPRGSSRSRTTRRPESGQRADAAAPRAGATSYNGQRATDVMSSGAGPLAEAGRRAADSEARSAAAMPPTQSAQAASAQSARTLILEARRAIANGNYRTAINRMDVCITMMDPVPQECRTLRISAEYQQQAMERCLASGADWVGDHCE